MRTSFELKFVADNLDEAKEIAIGKVALFLNIDKSDVEDSVSLELKVSYPESKTIPEIEQSTSGTSFVVTAYGSVKQSVAKTFGL